MRRAGLFSLKSLFMMSSDGLAWAAGISLTTIARFEFQSTSIVWHGVIQVIGLAIGAQIIYGSASGMYTGRWRVASFEETGVLGFGAVIIGAGMFMFVSLSPNPHAIPLSVTIAGALGFGFFALGSRFLYRAGRDAKAISSHDRHHRAIIFGAGEGGVAVVRALQRDTHSTIMPVAFLDDDPMKRNLRVAGCKVVGDRDQIGQIADRFDADMLILAVPSAEQANISAIATIARQHALRVLILPRVAASLEHPIRTSDIRDLTLSDFLGRKEVTLDAVSIATFLTGKRVLVTGAGGSIGSELCRQIRKFHPDQLFMLDRDESALHALQLGLDGQALLDDESLIIGDIRDSETMDRLFAHYRPDVVFHTAALKHVTFLERFPDEAIKTNIMGSQNILEAAYKAGVHRFVNVSTDKAAEPINVLGLTKRVSEMLTAGFAQEHGMHAVSVRFGNVLGSRGSLIPTLTKQIQAGIPVTITDPDATRFFMTIEEAAQLILQAGAIGESGSTLVLDMGDPVSILKLAEQLQAELDPEQPFDAVYTGLRPGEKLHEVLIGSDELLLGHPHEAIAAYRSGTLSIGAVHNIEEQEFTGPQAKAILHQLVSSGSSQVVI